MDLDSGYTFAAVVLTFMSIILFFLIREPVIKDRSKIKPKKQENNDIELEELDNEVL